MRRLIPLALVAGALTTFTGSASAACYGANAGGTSAHVCNRRVWEKQQWYLTCTLDTDLDGQPDAMCVPIVLIEYYG